MHPSLAMIRCKPESIKSHTRRIEGPAGATKVAAGLIVFRILTSISDSIAGINAGSYIVFGETSDSLKTLHPGHLLET